MFPQGHNWQDYGITWIHNSHELTWQICHSICLESVMSWMYLDHFKLVLLCFVMFSCGFTKSTAFLGICRTWACFNPITLSTPSPPITSVAQVLCCACGLHCQINPTGHPMILLTLLGPLTDLIITLLHKHHSFAWGELSHLLNMRTKELVLWNLLGLSQHWTIIKQE